MTVTPQQAICASDRLPYGRALRAELDSDEFAEATAWLIVPATHDVVLVTWLAGDASYGASAAELLATLRPGLFSSAIGAAVEIAGAALSRGELSPHAVLFGNGRVVQVELGPLPKQIWNDACRVERASTNAEVVIQVLPATANGSVDVAMIYAESESRERRLVVGDGAPVELDTARVNLFASPDPRIAAALAAARRTTA